MARCEDFPCCGHEPGCCPDYDPETGRQLNMKCTCGATLPLNSRYSICETCMNMPSDNDYPDPMDYDGPEYDPMDYDGAGDLGYDDEDEEDE